MYEGQDEDDYDLLNKSVNSPDYLGHNINDTTVRFLFGGKQSHAGTQYSS